MTSKRNIIRQANMDNVKLALFKNKKMFASEIVETTKISMVTVNILLKELVEEKIVLEHPHVQKDLGRPATQYEFNVNYQKSLLFAFRESGRTLYVDIFTINMIGEILEHEKEDFQEVSPASFQLLIAAKLKGKKNIDSLAFLLPAKISEGVITSSWYEKMNGWNVKGLVEEITDKKCYFQNDAHVLTVGHCIMNSIKFSETIVGIYYPSNSMPGVTVLVNSLLLEGQNSLAGEAKYLPLFLERGAASNFQEFIENFNTLLAIYNSVVAPNRFVLSIEAAIQEEVAAELSKNKFLPKQANSPAIDYIDNLEQCIVYGLHWMIYKGTPYELAVY